MNINEQQYIEDFINISKTVDKIWCLKDEEISKLKGCLVRVALYKEKLFCENNNN